MKIIDDIKKVDSENCYLTIGNFDGVHLGHRDFLSLVKKEADSANGAMVVVTFIPHPNFVLKNLEGFLINSYEERRKLLEEVGVDFLLEINFNRDFSTLSPGDFLDNYIFTKNNIRKIFLGHDFTFGANKSGDFSFVEKYLKNKGVDLYLANEFRKNNEVISSTVVRKLITGGEVAKAKELLNRRFFITGTVIKGAGRGKQIGFPTANISYSDERIIPALGVYVTEIEHRGVLFKSLTNVGHNPTFEEGPKIHIETHILDFDNIIYGEEVTVRFCDKIRDERKFNSANDLIDQIQKDIEYRRNYGKC